MFAIPNKVVVLFRLVVFRAGAATGSFTRGVIEGDVSVSVAAETLSQQAAANTVVNMV